MKRTLVFSLLLILAVFALAAQSARADEITFMGTTSSTPPSGITFTPGSFSGTTVGGFAAFSNLGTYFLSAIPATYNSTVNLIVTFSLPSVIVGGSSANFVANLVGIVINNTTGGVDITFTNASQNFSFSNAGGSGSFTFNVNSISVNPGASTTVSGSVTNAIFTPVPEPSSLLLLGAGLFLTPLLRIKRAC